MGRTTLVKIEMGHTSVGVGQYLNVLKVFGLEKDFLLVAKDDELARKWDVSSIFIWKAVNAYHSMFEVNNYFFRSIGYGFYPKESIII